MKELDQLIEKYNLQTQNKIYFGTINNYQICFKVDAFSALSCVGQISCFLDNRIGEINYLLKDNAKELGILNYKISHDGIFIVMKTFTIKGAVKNLEKSLDFITDKLFELGFDGSKCPKCGKELVNKKELCYLNPLINTNFSMHVCEDCYNHILDEENKKEEAYKKMPNNYLKGTLGAFVGALLGGMVWIIVGLFGYVASMVAFLISFLGSYGYDLMKGKKNKIKLLIVSIVSIFVIILSTFILFIIVCGSFNGFVNFLATSDGLKEFLLNLLLALVFGALGITWSILQMKKDIHK